MPDIIVISYQLSTKVFISLTLRGRGLLREAFGVRGRVLSVLENGGEHWSTSNFQQIKTNAGDLTVYTLQVPPKIFTMELKIANLNFCLGVYCSPQRCKIGQKSCQGFSSYVTTLWCICTLEQFWSAALQYQQFLGVLSFLLIFQKCHNI